MICLFLPVCMIYRLYFTSPGKIAGSQQRATATLPLFIFDSLDFLFSAWIL
jgi:hypothetical protein